MATLKIPAEWYDDDAVLAAGLEARALYIAAQMECARRLTDGHIPRSTLGVLAAKAGVPDHEAASRQLVAVGLWEPTDRGWFDARYLDFNPSAARAAATAAARAEAGRAGGQKSGEVRRSKQNASDLLRADRSKNEAKTKQNLKQNASEGGDLSTGYPLTYPLESGDLSTGYPLARRAGFVSDDADPVAFLRARADDTTTTSIPESSVDRIVREQTSAASAAARARESGLVGIDEIWPGQREAFADFQHVYPKTVADDLWSEFRERVPAPEVYIELRDGLARWVATDSWKEEYPRFCSAPLKFLSEQMWRKAPRPATPLQPAAVPMLSEKAQRTAANLRALREARNGRVS